MLSNPKLSDDERKGITQLLERILFETDNYQGYSFLNWLNGGFNQWGGQMVSQGIRKLILVIRQCEFTFNGGQNEKNRSSYYLS